ncbi:MULTISPECIES: CTP synthase [unclassified Sphingomonas]|uniref:CTP synthase n=1 Tax=unclassified Sphingomonas TaxID=196159 RepID=UPI0022B41DDD|nr:CTP synthase [Sphingomonas sp. NIBR02145]WHU03581.1 CTP synthase [Sphingomonas sp. NIBR02145]
MARYIFITGGVVSSLGKGLMAASLAALLQARGYRVRIRKFDPYLNVDPGTMSPHQHGEVYVTDDGAETDLDLGHYERFTGVASRQSDNITSGRIYKTIIERERRGDYLGATVQVIPHVTDAIKAFAQADTEDLDFVLCEIGGTVGDIESLPFVEAIRQLRNDLGRNQSVSVHLTLVPYIAAAGELKTKPTQHSVRELASLGVHADVIVCRSEKPLPASDRAKIALFCNVPASSVIPALDAPTIYGVPLQYHAEGLDVEVLKAFGIDVAGSPDLARWEEIEDRVLNPEGEVTIGVVGKYMGVPDAYKSLTEALTHGGIANRVKVNIRWLDAELFEHDNEEEITAQLEPLHGILVPGGFGERGSEGKIAGVKFARERNVPFFGICLGMQMACIEGVRAGGIANASTTEFGPTEEPVVGMITEWMTAEGLQKREEGGDLGGTMRLGAYTAKLGGNSVVSSIYGSDEISERHRHRYEVNTAYKPVLEQGGLVFSGMSPDGSLPEIVERPDHPWFVGVQFHPELKSKPFEPHPLFASFIEAAVRQSRLV